LLEDNADIGAQLIEVGALGMDLDAIDGDLATLDGFEPVDAHEQG
jgi:hypothetical protein